MASMKTVDIFGCPLTYFDINPSAPGPAVVYIHGNSMSAEAFRGVWSAPGLTNVRQIALNLPGHGGSGWLPKYSLEIFADIVHVFAKALGLRAPHLVGNSLGGHICVQVMERLRPSSVFLFGNPPAGKPLSAAAFLPCQATPLLFSSGPDSDAELAPLWEALGYTAPQAQEACGWYRETDPAFRQMMLESVGRGEYTDELAILSQPAAPTTFLICERDPIVSNAYIWRTLAELHPSIATVSLDVGHVPQVEEPAHFSQVLTNHLHRHGTIATTEATNHAP